jgi:uncharacterized membrane protein YeaQ/YmgE (transglycosylase-associated protein family)
MVDMVLHFLGIPYMSQTAFWFLAAIAFSLSVAFGWLADALMDDLSFGIPFNAVLLTIGALGTYFLWRYAGLSFQHQFLYMFIGTLGFGSAIFLLFCVFLRRFL